MNKAELGAAGVNSQARSHTHKVGVWLGLMGAWTGNQTSDAVCRSVICGLQVLFAACTQELFIILFLLGHRFGLLAEGLLSLFVSRTVLCSNCDLRVTCHCKCHLHTHVRGSYTLLEFVDERTGTFAGKKGSMGRAGCSIPWPRTWRSLRLPSPSWHRVGDGTEPPLCQPLGFCCQGTPRGDTASP